MSPARDLWREAKSLAGGFSSGPLTCTGAGSCWKSPSSLGYKMLSVASLPDPRSRLPVFSGAGELLLTFVAVQLAFSSSCFFSLAFKLFLFFSAHQSQLLSLSLEQTPHLFDHRQACKSCARINTRICRSRRSVLSRTRDLLFVYAPAKRNVKIQHHRPRHRLILDFDSSSSFRSSSLETE